MIEHILRGYIDRRGIEFPASRFYLNFVGADIVPLCPIVLADFVLSDHEALGMIPESFLPPELIDRCLRIRLRGENANLLSDRGECCSHTDPAIGLSPRAGSPGCGPGPGWPGRVNGPGGTVGAVPDGSSVGVSLVEGPAGVVVVVGAVVVGEDGPGVVVVDGGVVVGPGSWHW
ncbi:hypothetical protein [Nocardia neocaledoniensis]|uniref:hypothetical protein n=1 Tax=Nocardia neocaledoniensis TaxID=236511 RepID=UPI0024588325|nr:hypothetical protein [Nocardia neocaledoniensis]